MSSIVLTNTTSAKISAALLKARRNAGSPSMGMVLTLIIVADEKDYEAALEAGTSAGREHPARILLVVTAGGRQASLDAEVRLRDGTPGEVVVIRMKGAVATHPASVIRPLLLPDSPVVIWWPGACPASTANDELAQLAVRRLTDAAAVRRPRAALLDRARSYQPGDTDLAWTRLTRWRGLLAAALDQYPSKVQSVTVEAERGNPSAELLSAWLQRRLKAPVRLRPSEGPGITSVRMTTHTGDIAITRPDGLLASYTVPAQPERLVALKRREITDLISEELRRLDDDPIYERAVKSLLEPDSGPTKTATKKTAAKKTPAEKTADNKTPAKKARDPEEGELAMTDGPEILVHDGADDVAEALTARLSERLVELQREGRVPAVCLTGGRIADRAYGRLAAEGRNSAVDWAQVDLWWGDERFVPADDADRNAKQALDVLRLALPLDDGRIHPMPASDGGLDLDAAAAAYDTELGDTRFDVCLLGMGPDGHVASLFPDHPSSRATGRVIGVRNSPKPPPDRISLTLEVINASAEVWFLVSGDDKAEAVAKAVLGTGSAPVPAAGVAARRRTLWLVDRAAAALLPTDLVQPDVP